MKTIAGASGMGRAGVIAVTAVILCVLAVVYFKFVAPMIQVRHTVRGMVTAFEQEDVTRLVDYLDIEFRNNANFVRADVEDFLVFYFDYRENIKIRIKKQQVIIRGKKAIVNLSGTLSYTTRQGAQTVEIDDPPLTLFFRRTPQGWRVYDAAGGDALGEAPQ